MERTWPPETVSSSLSASLSLSSLTLQTLSCCFHLWRHAQRQSFSLFWLVESAASLPPHSGWKDTIHLHWVEAWLLTSFPHPLETQISGTSAENQHILPLCFSVLLPIVWLCFFLMILCILVSDPNVYWCSLLKQALSHNEKLCAL